MKYLSQHEATAIAALQCVEKATTSLMSLDLALISFDHRKAQIEVGNIQAELSSLKKLIEELRGGA
jgi:hypothetical protein